MLNGYSIVGGDGHGDETPGKRTAKFADGSFIHENEFNKAVLNKIDKIAQQQGFKFYQVAAEDEDVLLGERIARENYIYDRLPVEDRDKIVFISIHYNALNGVFDNKSGGIETYSYPGSKNGLKLAMAVHKEVIKGTKQVDRGTKTSKFFVLRYTKSPAILIEFGFMDKHAEAILMRNEEFQTECAIEVVRGICKYFGLTYKEPEKDDGLYEAAKLSTEILTNAMDEYVNKLRNQ